MVEVQNVAQDRRGQWRWKIGGVEDRLDLWFHGSRCGAQIKGSEKHWSCSCNVLHCVDNFNFHLLAS